MVASYQKLWKLLKDKGMRKCHLSSISGLSTASMAKLTKNKNVNTDILVRVCNALKCDISDIMEMIDEENNNQVR